MVHFPYRSDGGAADEGDGDAAACSFAGARVHPRVSTPTLKGCAAVPLRPHVERQKRWRALCSASLPARRRSGTIYLPAQRQQRPTVRENG